MALLFYGYATGVFSSRKLSQATHHSVAFRFTCANTNPDHCTIAELIKRFLAEQADTKSLPEPMDIPAELQRREQRLEVITTAQAELAASGKFEQSYNAQAGGRHRTYLIVEEHVTQHANDKQEIAPALEKLDALPEELGDTRYHSEANVELCQSVGIEPLMPSSHETHN